MQDRENMIIINNFIENDPLSENNLDKTLDLVNRIRLSCPVFHARRNLYGYILVTLLTKYFLLYLIIKRK